MKLKYLLQKLSLAMVLMFLLGTSGAFGQATLTHSYTFEDGTADDAVGTLNGTVNGSFITIADGRCTVSGATGNTDGYIVFDGVALDLASYSAITLEAMVETGDVLNSSYTMLAYFGPTSQGQNCFWIQPTRGDTETRIETNNGTGTITALLSGYEVDDGLKHHIAAVLSSTDLIYYLDGAIIAQTSTDGADYISTLGTDIAQLFKGPDGWADPNYNCSLDEFNIYDGVIDQVTLAQHVGDYLGVNVSDATLSSLSTNKGPVDPVFDPAEDLYEILVPYGTATITIDAVPTVSGASVEMFGLGGELLEDGIVSLDETGIDVEIVVTSMDASSDESYFLTIEYDSGEKVATLSNITLSIGSLTTDFIADSIAYKAIVPNGTTSLDVTGVASWAGAVVTGGGTLSLTDGAGIATITVTSEDGNATKVYTVEINAATIEAGQDLYMVHESSGLVAEEIGTGNFNIRLNYPMRDSIKQIFQLEESGVADQYYLKNGLNHYLVLAPPHATISEDWDMTMVDGLLNDLDSCRFWIDEFEPGRFSVKSVSRFDHNYYNDPTKIYMGTNDNSVLTGIFNDKFPGNSLAVWNLKVPADVISPYDTDLDTLSVDPGSLSPVFSKYVKDYYVTLPVGTTSITVAAAAIDVTATVSGDGTVDVSDGAGEITITVTASDPDYSQDYVIHYIVNTALALKHSYTFADGTAKDVEGDADGTIVGGSISEGVYNASDNGDHMSLPGEEIAINAYPSMTLEVYVEDDPTTTQANNNTMLTYFGTTTGNFGTDYFFTSLKSRAAVSCLNTSSPWGSESGVSGGNLHDDGLPHHIVSVLNNDSVIFYIDGTIVGRALMSADNKISNISNTFAYLCKSGYTGDPTWLGNVLEYNIYSGEMDAATVALRAADFPVEDSTSDATLLALVVDSDTIDGFESYILDYSVVLPKGTTMVPTVTGANPNTLASIAVTAATELPGTTTVLVTSEDGLNVNTYTVNFSIELSDEASLSDLKVDGATITGFASGVTTYVYVLASGVTTVPTVVAIPTDAGADVVVTNAAALPGVTSVAVTAEDGETKLNYTISFIFDFSDDASLSDLTVDGSTVAGFSKDVTAYIVLLPEGSTVVPTVDATTTDDNAEYTVTDAPSLPGATSIAVVAEDGSPLTYYVNFLLEVSARPVDGSTIQVYPTVSDGNFRLLTGEGRYHIEIYNITGTKISEMWSFEAETKINTPKAGMYFLRVENEDIIRTFRIIHAK